MRPGCLAFIASKTAERFVECSEPDSFSATASMSFRKILYLTFSASGFKYSDVRIKATFSYSFSFFRSAGQAACVSLFSLSRDICWFHVFYSPFFQVQKRFIPISGSVEIGRILLAFHFLLSFVFSNLIKGFLWPIMLRPIASRDIVAGTAQMRLFSLQFGHCALYSEHLCS